MGLSTAQVGANADSPQLTTTWHNDLFAPVGLGDVTTTAQDIVDLAVAQGATYPGGVAVVAADTIHEIDMDLKPIAGHGQIYDTMGGTFSKETSTTSDAFFTENGGQTDVDAGGSRTGGEISSGGAKMPSLFESVTTLDGSISVVSIVFLQS